MASRKKLTINLDYYEDPEPEPQKHQCLICGAEFLTYSWETRGNLWDICTPCEHPAGAGFLSGRGFLSAANKYKVFDYELYVVAEQARAVLFHLEHEAKNGS